MIAFAMQEQLNLYPAMKACEYCPPTQRYVRTFLVELRFSKGVMSTKKVFSKKHGTIYLYEEINHCNCFLFFFSQNSWPFQSDQTAVIRDTALQSPCVVSQYCKYRKEDYDEFLGAFPFHLSVSR